MLATHPSTATIMAAAATATAVGQSNGLGYAASTAAPSTPSAPEKAKGADDLTLRLEFGCVQMVMLS